MSRREELLSEIVDKRLVDVQRWLYQPDCKRFGKPDAGHLADGLTFLRFEPDIELYLQPQVENVSIEIASQRPTDWTGSYRHESVASCEFWSEFLGESVVDTEDPDEKETYPGSDYALSFSMTGSKKLVARLHLDDDRLYFTSSRH